MYKSAMIKTQKNAPTANMTAMDRTPSTMRNTKKRFTPETISRRINPTKATAMQSATQETSPQATLPRTTDTCSGSAFAIKSPK